MLRKRFYPNKMFEYDNLLFELKQVLAWGGDKSRIESIQKRLKELNDEGWGYEDV